MMRQTSSTKSFNRYQDYQKDDCSGKQKFERKASKKEIYQDMNKENNFYSNDHKIRSNADHNPAASLVTQVPQGASKPAVDPTQIMQLESEQEHIVLGPPKTPGKK